MDLDTVSRLATQHIISSTLSISRVLIVGFLVPHLVLIIWGGRGFQAVGIVPDK